MKRHLAGLRRSGLVALAALALLTAVAGTGLLIYREYQKTSDDAQRGATKIASLLASDIGGRLYAVDGALTDISLEVERFLLLRDVRSAAQMETAREELLIQVVRRANPAIEIESIAVIGVDRGLDGLRTGAWPDDAPTESAYFRAVLADRNLRFHVDLPRPDRWTGALSAVVATTRSC